MADYETVLPIIIHTTPDNPSYYVGAECLIISYEDDDGILKSYDYGPVLDFYVDKDGCLHFVEIKILTAVETPQKSEETQNPQRGKDELFPEYIKRLMDSPNAFTEYHSLAASFMSFSIRGRVHYWWREEGQMVQDITRDPPVYVGQQFVSGKMSVIREERYAPALLADKPKKTNVHVLGAKDGPRDKT